MRGGLSTGEGGNSVSLTELGPSSSAPAAQVQSGDQTRDTADRVIDSLTLTERLGYAPDARLLIVHADDLGVAHSVDAASINALETGLVNSGSIMVPCPSFAEIAAYARSHPEKDLGLHLTLTSEWPAYRWGPVASKDRVPTLLDKDGYLHPTDSEALARIDPAEAEIEIRSQVERALDFGIKPSHLDSHMGILFLSRELFEVLLRVARDYKLPALLSRDRFEKHAYLTTSLTPDDVVIDHALMIHPEGSAETLPDLYAEALRNMAPGVTQLVVHLAYDDQEMRAITGDHPLWGGARRQGEFDYFTSLAFSTLLDENNIKFVTWRQIGSV
jgi:predicted glycoside hydrolase/deacetylase ChbG (UPF0249 family)